MTSNKTEFGILGMIPAVRWA